MGQEPAEPVVVGVDGSERSHAAVGWAAREAARRGRRLRLLGVVEDGGTGHLGDAPGPGYPHQVRREAARGRLEGAAAGARETGPGVVVEVDLVDGEPEERLIALSRAAALVVVGNSAHGPLRGLLLGSVLTAIAGRTACPLVAVRAPTAEGAPVVVGVHDVAGDAAALRFAFESADRAGVALVVAHTWIGTNDRGEASDAAPSAVSVAGWSRAFPDVEVRQLAGRDRPADTLAELAGGAQLAVLGSRGRPAPVGAVLDSVGREVLHRAACPVAIVPARLGTIEADPG